VRGSIYVTDKAGTVTFEERDEVILTVVCGYAGRLIDEHW
jgi:hypothetical protein